MNTASRKFTADSARGEQPAPSLQTLDLVARDGAPPMTTSAPA